MIFYVWVMSFKYIPFCNCKWRAEPFSIKLHSDHPFSQIVLSSASQRMPTVVCTLTQPTTVTAATLGGGGVLVREGQFDEAEPLGFAEAHARCWDHFSVRVIDSLGRIFGLALKKRQKNHERVCVARKGKVSRHVN